MADPRPDQEAPDRLQRTLVRLPGGIGAVEHHPVRRNADPGASPFLDLCRTGGQHRLDIGSEGV